MPFTLQTSHRTKTYDNNEETDVGVGKNHHISVNEKPICYSWITQWQVLFCCRMSFDPEGQKLVNDENSLQPDNLKVNPLTVQFLRRPLPMCHHPVKLFFSGLEQPPPQKIEMFSIWNQITWYQFAPLPPMCIVTLFGVTRHLDTSVKTTMECFDPNQLLTKMAN